MVYIIVEVRGKTAPTAPTAESTSATEATDLVLKNGEIRPLVSERRNRPSPLNGAIVYVGDNAGVEPYTGEGTKVIDLEKICHSRIYRWTHPQARHPTGPWKQSLICTKWMLIWRPIRRLCRISFFANPDSEIYNATRMDLKAFPNSNPTNEWLDEILLRQAYYHI